MKKLAEIATGAVAFIIGLLGLIYVFSKNSTAQVQKDNANALNQVASNDASLTDEEAKRQALETNLNKEENAPQTEDNVVQFFNNRPKS